LTTPVAAPANKIKAKNIIIKLLGFIVFSPSFSAIFHSHVQMNIFRNSNNSESTKINRTLTTKKSKFYYSEQVIF